MKKKIFLLLLKCGLLLSNLISAQVSNYSFNSSTGSYTNIIGTQIIAPGIDDGNSAVINIGFDFIFNGTTFTQFVANSNGCIRLGSSAPGTPFTAISTTSNTNTIAFYSRDGKTGDSVVYELTGTFPNRILTIQYSNWYPIYNSTSLILNAQIKLYETSNVIQFVYGSSTGSSSTTGQVGLRGSSLTTDFSSRSSSTDWDASISSISSSNTMTLSSTVKPLTGLIYEWTPPQPCDFPTDQATNFSISTITSSSITGSFLSAISSPSGYLVVRSTNSTLNANPVNGTSYSSGNSLGGGTVVGTPGTSTSISATGLTAGTQYYFFVFAYNNTTCSGGPVYNITSPLIGTATTCLSGIPSTPTLANETTTSIQASWSAFNGATSYRLDVSTNSSFSSFVTGYQDLVVSGTSQSIAGLNPNTLYYVRVRAHNESCPSSNSNTASRTTLKIEPTNQPTNFAAGIVTTSNIPLSWTAAAVGSQLPDGYLIKGSATSLEAISDPVDGIDSTNDTSFSDGIAMVKTTTNPYSSFANQTAGTMYYYKIYSYTNTTTSSTTSTTIDYKTDNVPTLYHATLPAVNTAPVFSGTTANATTISWSQPVSYSNSNHSTLVFVKAVSAVTFGTPNSNPVNYSANTSFGLGTTYQNDALAYCVYKGDINSVTVYGLDGNTNYHVLIVTVVDATNSNGLNSYSAALASSKTTLCDAIDSFNITFEESSNLPSCTSFLSSDSLGANINTSNPYQGTRCLGLQSSTTFILPAVNNTHLNTHQISFFARTAINTTGTIGFGYLTDPLDANTFNNLQSFTLNSTYQLCSYIPINNIPQNALLAIKMTGSAVLRVDNIVWEPKPVVIWNNQNWSNISGPTEFDDVEIHDNLNLTQNLSANNLTVLANQILTVGPNIILNIKGNLNNNGQIIFKSDATGTGVFGQFTGSISGLGNATVEQYIPSRRAWRLLTAPTKGSTSNTVQDNWQGTNGEGVLLWGPIGTGLAVGPQNNIYSYNGAWTPVTNTTTTNLFDTDKNNAFLVFAVGPHGGNNIASTNAAVETTLRPKGSLITGDVSYSGLTTNAFQLIANPYASPISTSALKTTNPDFNIWLLDPSLGTIGGYYTYDGNNWTPETPAGDAVNIQSGQGFFVRSASATSFTINETHKAVGNSNTWFAKPSVQTTEENKIRVLLDKQENNQWQLVDGILSVSGNNYSNAVDAQDALKVSNFNENILFRNGTSNLAIEYQNMPSTATEQPIRLTGTTATSYRLRVKTESFVSVNVQPILQDTQSGTNHLIPTDGSTIEIPFTGEVATTTNPDQRFKIVYQQVLGVDQPITNTLQVYPNPVREGQFTVVLPNPTEVATYEITNYLGQVVQKGNLTAGNTNVSIASQAVGVYLVRVQQNGLVYTTKIVKK